MLLRCAFYMCSFFIFVMSCFILMFSMSQIVNNVLSHSIQVFFANLALCLCLSTIHHCLLSIVLAPLLWSILDSIAALSEKQIVDGRKNFTLCLHSKSYCPLLTMSCNLVSIGNEGSSLVGSMSMIETHTL